MELVYLSDPMAKLSAWGTYSTWDENNFKNNVGKQQLNRCKEIKTSEKNCTICQQRKKRILSHYIRSKQIDCRNPTSIQEENEEEEEEETKKVEEDKDKR